jgi:Ca2+-binding EF-hand superfamily protein
MPVPIMLAALLAQSPIASSPSVTVTGHQWAPFISPMGEPFRANSATDDTLADWFYQADRNRDGVLTVDEMVKDADRFFATLDTNHDGQIDPDEIAAYEYEIAPEIQVMSRTRRAPGDPPPAARKNNPDEGSSKERRRREDDAYASLGMGNSLQGGARYSLLNIPEPVAAADTDFNRAVTLEEFRHAAVQRFQLLDTAHQGKLTLAQLEAMRPVLSRKKKLKLDDDTPDARIGDPLPSGP